MVNTIDLDTMDGIAVMVSRKVRNMEWREDAKQEAILAMLKQEDAQPGRGWWYKIANNAVIQFLREEKRQPKGCGEDLPPRHCTTPYPIQLFLDELPPRQKEVISTYLVNDYDVDKTAAICQVTPRRIRMILQDATQRL